MKLSDVGLNGVDIDSELSYDDDQALSTTYGGQRTSFPTRPYPGACIDRTPRSTAGAFLKFSESLESSSKGDREVEAHRRLANVNGEGLCVNGARGKAGADIGRF